MSDESIKQEEDQAEKKEERMEDELFVMNTLPSNETTDQDCDVRPGGQQSDSSERIGIPTSIIKEREDNEYEVVSNDVDTGKSITKDISNEKEGGLKLAPGLHKGSDPISDKTPFTENKYDSKTIAPEFGESEAKPQDKGTETKRLTLTDLEQKRFNPRPNSDLKNKEQTNFAEEFDVTLPLNNNGSNDLEEGKQIPTKDYATSEKQAKALARAPGYYREGGELAKKPATIISGSKKEEESSTKDYAASEKHAKALALAPGYYREGGKIEMQPASDNSGNRKGEKTLVLAPAHYERDKVEGKTLELAPEPLKYPSPHGVDQGEKLEEVKEEEKATPVGAFLTRPGGYIIPADRRPFGSIIREQQDFEYESIDREDSESDRKKEDILIEAHAVKDPVLVTAQRETFFRRHQWWIVGGSIITAMIIIAVAVFTTVDFSGSEQPTYAPTTIEEGIEAKVKELIIDQIPAAETTLLNEELPQYKAFQWIVDKRYSGVESWYTDKRILSQYSLATLFLSTSINAGDGSISSSWHNVGRFLNKTDNASGSSTWYSNANWMETDDECDWHGISCDENGDIVGLHLTDNNLKGTIPADIGLLSSLLSLDLNGNLLSGSIPTELFMLTKLSTLNLAHNIITGRIPNVVSQVTNLTLLNLSDNNLSSTLPLELGELRVLTHIIFANNALSGSVPSEIGKLVMLKDLDVRSNSLTYELPTEIGSLSSLIRLSLQENKLLGPLPSEIRLLSSLQAWNMSNNNVFDKIPTSLWQGGSLRNLESLDLSHNLLTGDEYDFESFGESWGKLTSLRLGKNFLRGDSNHDYSLPKSISQKLKSLTEIDISSNFFVGTVPDEFLGMGEMKLLKLGNSGLKFQDGSEEVLNRITSKLLSLAELDLTKCNVNGFIPTQIGMLKKLESIQLSLNGLTGTIPSHFGFLSQLTEIRLDINQFTGTIPPQIFTLNNLTSISFASNKLNGTIPSQIGLLSSLEIMEFQYNKLTGTIPSQIGLLSNMDVMYLDSNQFTGTIPSEIGNINNASEVFLWDNLLTGTIPTQIGLLSKFGNLRKIWLDRNNLNGTIPTQVGMLNSLESLHLYSNELTGTIPSQIGKLTKLGYIFLNNNTLTGTIPSAIGNMDEWRMINLHYNRLTGMIPSDFGNVDRLETLNLAGNQLFGSIPLSLCKIYPYPEIKVDCKSVTCYCCGCIEYTPTSSPFPSMPPSLSQYPSTTHIPSLLPSSSQAPTLEAVIITIEIQFDEYPCDTGWSITDDDKNMIYDIPSGTYSAENKNSVDDDQVSLSLGFNYTFQLKDTHGDGLKGRVIIYLGDTPDMNSTLGYYVYEEGNEFTTHDILFHASEKGIIENNF